MEADEEGTLARLRGARSDVIEPTVASHRGRVFKTTGDGFLAEFASVVDAARCAAALQTALAAHETEIDAERRIAWRLGLNLGDVVVDDGDVHGDGVNVAARLEALAEPGTVCVSGTAHEHLRGKLKLAFEDLGEHALKNIERPVRVYRLAAHTTAEPPRPALPLPDKPSLVVLPFQNMSGEAEQDYFADGMTEEITTALSRIRQFFVIARNTAFTYKGKKLDLRQVGRELGVRYLLEGSVRKAGNRVRITGQLIEAETGTHLWADRFDGALEDVFDLQDRVTSSVVGAIEPSITRAEIERASRKPPENLQAHDMLLRAIAETWIWTRDGTDRALGWARQAVRIDQRYGLAHSYVAVCLGRRQYMGWADDDTSEIAEGTHAAELAATLAADDPLALANAAVGAINLFADRGRSLEWVNRALALNPNSALSLNCSALVRNYDGDYTLAADHAQRALRLSPFDSLAHIFCYACGFSHLARRMFPEAIQWYRRSVQLNSRLPIAHVHLASALARAGELSEASVTIKRLIEWYPVRASDLRRRLRTRYRISEDFDYVLDGARLAGLPD
ncbi:MAG: hypothetical protein JNK67_05625 [Alphaproteobacteria bacterium]|nr:hypothetical protein [Alphaproteobacteria bacterium]